MVLPETAGNFNFHAWLLAVDTQAAQQMRLQGCPRCAGPLYAAHYERKTRGLGPEALKAGRYELRLSLCCGREGCRARATPNIHVSIRNLTFALRAMTTPQNRRTAARSIAGSAAAGKMNLHFLTSGRLCAHERS